MTKYEQFDFIEKYLEQEQQKIQKEIDFYIQQGDMFKVCDLSKIKDYLIHMQCDCIFKKKGYDRND